MNHKKLLNVALRVGEGSMGMQGITELFHPWARKSIYWMPCRRQKVFEKNSGNDTNANTNANTYKGTNIRFVVTKNRNNSPETIYKRYCKRGEMELSAVYIVEKKTFIHVSFSPYHRHLEELTVALERLAA